MGKQSSGWAAHAPSIAGPSSPTKSSPSKRHFLNESSDDPDLPPAKQVRLFDPVAQEEPVLPSGSPSSHSIQSSAPNMSETVISKLPARRSKTPVDKPIEDSRDQQSRSHIAASHRMSTQRGGSAA